MNLRPSASVSVTTIIFRVDKWISYAYSIQIVEEFIQEKCVVVLVKILKNASNVCM